MASEEFEIFIKELHDVRDRIVIIHTLILELKRTVIEMRTDIRQLSRNQNQKWSWTGSSE